jgi:hypothetical protein
MDQTHLAHRMAVVNYLNPGTEKAEKPIKVPAEKNVGRIWRCSRCNNSFDSLADVRKHQREECSEPQ